jgi:uncharacterized protein YicC (UPF0701 family)
MRGFLTSKSQLDEKHYAFIHEYDQMLSTIEEAFQYVVASFDDYQKTEGDRILTDIFQAFTQIAESHAVLNSLFSENPSMTATIQRFEEVMNQAMKLDGSFADQNIIETVIKDHLYPAFSDWHKQISEKLNSYTLS